MVSRRWSALGLVWGPIALLFACSSSSGPGTDVIHAEEDAGSEDVRVPPAELDSGVDASVSTDGGSDASDVGVDGGADTGDASDDATPGPSIMLTSITPSSAVTLGNTGFAITGVDLTGVTTVTFDGVPATSIHVVNSTTVSGVTPPHVAGAVDVVVTTSNGTGVLANGFTFVAPAVGLPSGGGVIAALGGGLSNLIASTTDNGAAVVWGGEGVTSGSQSATDGAANTALIVATLGAAGAAAASCSSYEVDSSGNTPCQAGNACFDDWFLPARTQLGVLHDNRAAIGGFAGTYYWSSTESPLNAALDAVSFSVDLGLFTNIPKSAALAVRCVRTF